MFKIFRVILDRIKAFLLTQAALEIETEFIAPNADRQAQLFRLADRYAGEGLSIVASNVRRQAEALDIHQPLLVAIPVDFDHRNGVEHQRAPEIEGVNSVLPEYGGRNEESPTLGTKTAEMQKTGKRRR